MIPVCNCADGQTIQNFGGFEKCSKGIGIPTSITFNTEETVAGAVNGLILASETPNEAFFDSRPQLIQILKNLMTALAMY